MFFSFNSFAQEKFDYWNYKLIGEFKKEVYREDYFWVWKFLIYNNKIAILLAADVSEDMLEAFPDGEFILETYKGSKIRIKAENGIIKNFEILSDLNDFKKNEDKIKDNDYCEIAYTKLVFDEVYNKYADAKYLKIKDFEYGYKTNNRMEEALLTGFLLYKKDNKNIVINIYYDGIGKNSNEKQYFILDNDRLKEIKNIENCDVFIENCILKYYNPRKFSINSIND